MRQSINFLLYLAVFPVNICGTVCRKHLFIKFCLDIAVSSPFRRLYSESCFHCNVR